MMEFKTKEKNINSKEKYKFFSIYLYERDHWTGEIEKVNKKMYVIDCVKGDSCYIDSTE